MRWLRFASIVFRRNVGGVVPPLILVLICHSQHQAVQHNQRPQEEIRLSASLIEITFTVVDRRGRPVTDLTKDEFEIFQDGRKQEIAFFHQPVAEMISQAAPLSLALLIDVSGSMGHSLLQESKTIEIFLEKLPAGSHLAVLSFNQRLQVLQDFTSDRSLAQAAVKKTRSTSGGTYIYQSAATAIEWFNAYGGGMAGRRRKVLVIISDGFDNRSVMDHQAAIDAALRSNVKVFTVAVPLTSGFRMVATPGEFAELAKSTGGLAFNETATAGGLQFALDTIATHVRSEYLIAYSPDNAAVDGAFHRIDVKVKKKGLGVKNVRSGYKALTEAEHQRNMKLVEAEHQALKKGSELLKQYLSAPVMENQIVGALSVEKATPVNQDYFRVPFVIKLKYASLQPRKVSDSYLSTFAVLLSVNSLTASYTREFQNQFSLLVNEKDYKTTQKGETDFRSAVRVARGRYVLKVAILEIETGKAAVFETSFEVP